MHRMGPEIKPEVFRKVKPEPGPNPNPTRKARPDLQLCAEMRRSLISRENAN